MLSCSHEPVSSPSRTAVSCASTKAPIWPISVSPADTDTISTLDIHTVRGEAIHRSRSIHIGKQGKVLRESGHAGNEGSKNMRFLFRPIMWKTSSAGRSYPIFQPQLIGRLHHESGFRRRSTMLRTTSRHLYLTIAIIRYGCGSTRINNQNQGIFHASHRRECLPFMMNKIQDCTVRVLYLRSPMMFSGLACLLSSAEQ